MKQYADLTNGTDYHTDSFSFLTLYKNAYYDEMDPDLL